MTVAATAPAAFASRGKTARAVRIEGVAVTHGNGAARALSGELVEGMVRPRADRAPQAARALLGASLGTAARRCPACGAALTGRKRACSGRCRAELSRRRLAPMVPDEVLAVLGPHLSLSARTRTGRCKLSPAEWSVLFLVVTARGLGALQLANRLGLAGDVVAAAVDGLVAWRFLVPTPDGFSFQPDPAQWGEPA